MKVPTNIQTIVGTDGKPAFVVIPYEDYLTQFAQAADLIPHAVVRRVLIDDVPSLRAWREHLGLTQAEVAARLGISQPAYAQQENSERLRKTSRERIAAALGITAAQLDI
ncbi:helix-turn-helix domain-containing protein [Cupriavidus taiwanensis]|uniref:helix-turn-helix domain-containing protein n=1 Tax=Cupriavidus taiwanensis TaxID=164546 RepID=UPI000E102E45|nr:helix-turn-helix transcriptional regulator [Cupriavidus taiwanensis]SPA55236.1 XRE family transcriptional regulator [Cupriavidus taiwanensis]